MIANVPNKCAEAVTAATIEHLSSYREAIDKITENGGKEFSNDEELSTELCIAVYLATAVLFMVKRLVREHQWPDAPILALRVWFFKNVTSQLVAAVAIQLSQRQRVPLSF
jgi:hypothetical protein